jgi:hypothetical protein
VAGKEPHAGRRFPLDGQLVARLGKGADLDRDFHPDRIGAGPIVTDPSDMRLLTSSLIGKVKSMPNPSSAAGPAIFREGLNAGWPICLGYLPIGMAFGVLAQKAGLTPLQIGLMSVLVFAGSSQFIAVSMLCRRRIGSWPSSPPPLWLTCAMC